LIEAANRGVKVSLVLEASPRVSHANDDVYQLLKRSGNIEIRYVRHYSPHRSIFGGLPKVHEKIYYFKDNKRAFAYIGSYNPSGRENDDPQIIKRIGDQDRGHNFLVEIDDDLLVDELYNHCVLMKDTTHGFFEIFKKGKKEVSNLDTTLYFFPWAGLKSIVNFLNLAEENDKIYISASHIWLFGITGIFLKLRKKNVDIEIISHDTKRRFPKVVQKKLEKYSINCLRYQHPENYPMHNKFILIEKKNEKLVGFGSLNLTNRSLFESHEIFAVTKDESVVAAFKQRWNDMYKTITEQYYG
jgi:phosphatidylserine/phosphatidylglycerophosphate/cardiolipin synthase-like enzyme